MASEGQPQTALSMTRARLQRRRRKRALLLRYKSGVGDEQVLNVGKVAGQELPSSVMVIFEPGPEREKTQRKARLRMKLGIIDNNGDELTRSYVAALHSAGRRCTCAAAPIRMRQCC
eukprot:6205636-Pleurochrysis_carterae.AAC.2